MFLKMRENIFLGSQSESSSQIITPACSVHIKQATYEVFVLDRKVTVLYQQIPYIMCLDK